MEHDLIEIGHITDHNRIESITREIILTLPAWFDAAGQKNYPVENQQKYFLAATKKGKAIGFIAITDIDSTTAEIHCIGILEDEHGKGIGTKLINAAKAYCLDGGRDVLLVKTLDASAHYPPYDKTRRFYESKGFVSRRLIAGFWGAENPCLEMIWLPGTDSNRRPGD